MTTIHHYFQISLVCWQFRHSQTEIELNPCKLVVYIDWLYVQFSNVMQRYSSSSRQQQAVQRVSTHHCPSETIKYANNRNIMHSYIKIKFGRTLSWLHTWFLSYPGRRVYVQRRMRVRRVLFRVWLRVLVGAVGNWLERCSISQWQQQSLQLRGVAVLCHRGRVIVVRRGSTTVIASSSALRQRQRTAQRWVSVRYVVRSRLHEVQRHHWTEHKPPCLRLTLNSNKRSELKRRNQ